MTTQPVSTDILQYMRTNEGNDLQSLSREFPVLLIFLRHFGCVFCKEALADLAKTQSQFRGKEIKMVFVHMSDGEVADEYFEKYQLNTASHISDPNYRFYQAFGLEKARFSQLYGLSSWIRGFSAMRKGHFPERGEQLGNEEQMPGIFLLHEGEIKDRFIHKSVCDRPDYLKMLNAYIRE